MNTQRPEIIVKNVTKTFHQGDTAIHALRSVNFEVRAGHLEMIVGPSGSGKTTLLSVIAGVLFFEEGEVEIMGHSLHKMTEDQITEFRKKTIGFIFQMYNLIPTLTCLENVSIPLLLNGKSSRTAKTMARDYLHKVGLLEREDELPTHLSGGQLQRVAIARALVHEPKIIICDEPTASLDAETGAKIMELLHGLVKTKDRCVIVVTHDQRIHPYADSITKMDDGHILAPAQ